MAVALAVVAIIAIITGVAIVLVVRLQQLPQNRVCERLQREREGKLQGTYGRENRNQQAQEHRQQTSTGAVDRLRAGA
eukprot:scaffold2580_cov388-Prasinococcus_capsulatus_cf.AAC.19